jgi:hypothetical protein
VASDLPDVNKVRIGKNAIGMPLNRFILARKDNRYCAIKFLEFKENKPTEWYEKYESYYQGDGTGSFSSKNVIYDKGRVSSPPLIGIGRLSFSTGTHSVYCGDFIIPWSGHGTVYFHYEIGGSTEIYQLAPTKWSDVKDINVFDKRLKWYEYSETRKLTEIAPDKLWLN